MPAENESHECDLFLMSSHRPYVGDRILPAFARRGAANRDGWGIGSYVDGRARVLRREQPAAENGSLGEEFAIAVEAVSSPIVLGHLRLTSRGHTRRVNNHPFQLNFLGYDWLLIHNGTARNADRLVPPNERLLTESDSDTPRVFEFLRREIIAYLGGPRKSLIEACRSAYVKLLEADSGGFNLVLSNGHLSFAFIHHRPFFLLHREKDTGDVALVSTLMLTPEEDWVKFIPREDKLARMLVFSGPTLAFNGNVPA